MFVGFNYQRGKGFVIMKHRSSFVRVLMLIIAMLTLASLACAAPGSQPADTAEEETEAPEETEEPEEPTNTPAPTATSTTAPSPTADTRPTMDMGGVSTPSGGVTPGAGVTPAVPTTTRSLTVDNVANLAEKWWVTAHDDDVVAVAASPTDHRIATFGQDNKVRMWDGDTGDLLWEETTSVWGYGLAFSSDGSVLATGAGYHVLLWDASDGTLLRDTVVNANVFRIVWTPGDEYLAVVGSQSSRIFVINPYTGQQEFEIPGADSTELWAIAYARDSSYIATANAVGDVLVYGFTEEDYVFYDTQTADGAAWDLEFNSDASRLASCNDSGSFYVWDTTTWDSNPVLWGEGLHSACTDGVFSADGSMYFTAGSEGNVYAWDANVGGDSLFNIYTNNVPIWAISLTGDGEMLAVAIGDGTLSVWSLP